MLDEKIDVANHSQAMRSWWWLNILLIGVMFLLVGLGIGFYYAKTKQMLDTVNQVQAQIDNTQQAYQTTSATLESLQKNVQNQALQLNQQHQALQRITLLEQQKQWQLGEIRYLLNLANTSLLFAHDIKTSYKLLEQIHQTILMSHNPNLDVVDQAVQNDMQTLAAATLQDSTDIFMQITALNQAVATMPLLGSGFVKEELTQQASNAVVTTWREKLHQTWQQLRGFIIVQKTSNPLLPLLAQKDGDYIKQYVYLQLAEAQWAAQRHNTVVYQASLKQASAWISQYYVAQSPVTQNVINSLEKLEQMDVQFPMLALDKTMNALTSVSNH